MRFGIYVPNFGSSLGDPSVLVSLAVAAEDGGWDGFFLWDHVTLGGGGGADVVDPAGAMVTSLGRRRPWKVALEASTLQRLSGGRLVVGVGAGVPDDFVPFGEQVSRAAALSEGAALLRALLSGEPVEHHGNIIETGSDSYRRAHARALKSSTA